METANSKHGTSSHRLSSFTTHTWFSVTYLSLTAALSLAIGVPLASSGAVANPGLGFLAVYGVFLVAWLASLALRSSVTAGDDGIHVHWLGVQRFYGYDEIDVVAGGQVAGGSGYQLQIRLRSGKTIKLGGSSRAVEAVAAEASAALHRFEQLAAPERLAQLQASDEEPRQRLNRLRALGTGAAAGPRIAAVDEEALWRVIDSPKASEGERAAAAVVLANRHHDDASTQRLRIVAERTASPKLRVVIAGLTADEPLDEAELAAALAAVEQAERQRVE